MKLKLFKIIILITSISCSKEEQHCAEYNLTSLENCIDTSAINPNNSCLNYSYLDIDLHSNEEADNLNVVPTSSIAVFTVFLQSIACEIASINNLKLEEFVFNHPGGSIGKLK